MRLLKRDSTGGISLTKDFVGDDVPQYAILSHTWGADADEVTFKDLMDGTGRTKVGHKKIQFCRVQAGRDGLQYFWVDTCCIDKSNSNELSEAINSMFRWYRDAAKCYVYLSDVSRSASNADDELNRQLWHSDFRKSRWFTRGWTVQELLAPATVEFFSTEGEIPGNKESLERHICNVTGIPVRTLRESSLASFSITERISWQESRETKRKEDKAYSLLGICDVHMPLIYGEGRDSAFRRLREEIDKASKGAKREDLSIAFSLSNISDIQHFVAREEELGEMHKVFSGDGSRRTVVLQGLGGMGKTQLAIAYAKRHKDSYSAIFWLNTKDEDSLKQSFVKVARQIVREHPLASQLSGIDIEKSLDEVVDAVKSWLCLPDNTRWLMIYDNYDNPKLPGQTDPAAIDIRKFLPDSYQGSVIVTTRSSQVEIGHRIKIKKLEDMQESLEILLNASRRKELIEDPDAMKLVKELDGLPLALATAGAYLYQSAMSFSDYLHLYNASWEKLQKMSPGLSSYEDRTLASTWQISFDHVKQQNELSAMLLRLWAYFDNRDLWFELLRHAGPKDPKWIRELTEDELSFHAAARVLSDHGLVDVDMSSQEQIESRGYSIHGCVHSWVINSLNQELDHDMARLALKFVGSHVPQQETARWWLTQRRLLQHATRCSDLVLNILIVDDDIAWACDKLGDLYADQCKLAEAEQMYQQALEGCEKALGSDHTSTLNVVNNLGRLYSKQDKPKNAEQMYVRALEGREKTLGPDHISTLRTVNHLGNLYFFNQKKPKEAERMYVRALEGYEKTLGSDHTSTLSVVNNLGNIYSIDQSKLKEAEQMYVRALEGYEKTLGSDHTSTLAIVNNLGNICRYQDKLMEAEQMYVRVLEGHEKTLGSDHTLTLEIVNNMGDLYTEQSKLKAAEQMYVRALEGYEKTLGSNHTSTLNVVSNLGRLYSKQDKLKKAEQMYLRALKGYEKTCDSDHPQIQMIARILANFPNHSTTQVIARDPATLPKTKSKPKGRNILKWLTELKI